MTLLSRDELAALAGISTPTLANAIETFDLRPRNVGFAGPEIRPLFPELGPMVGYAFTVRIAADQPAETYSAGGSSGPPVAYWQAVADAPKPTVVVVEDIDAVPVGAYWGEVNSSIHQALGCIGTITQGGVRDLPEMRAIGFHAFAAAVHVSHAYVHVVDYGKPVNIGRLEVTPGELIHADQHGVLAIPLEIAHELPAAAAKIEELERGVIDYARQPGFTIEGLAEAWTRMRRDWPASQRSSHQDEEGSNSD